MRKTNSFFKFLKNINNFINNLLERNLNKLKFKNLIAITRNNKIILTFVAVFFIFLSYLLLPTFYKQADISKELQQELIKKFNLNFNFTKNLDYNFFPRPHFTTIDSTIIENGNEISLIKRIKIYLSITSLLSLKNIEVEDVLIEKANFNLNKQNQNFFKKILKNNFSDSILNIKNSNIFFRNADKEVLFINNIIKMKYYYDPNELKNILVSKNEIFNIPYFFKSFENEEEKKFFTLLNIDLLKIKIQNEIDTVGETKIGKSNIMFEKLQSIITYKIKKNYIEYSYFDKLENKNFLYDGKLSLKPFYKTLEGSSKKFNLSSLINSNQLIAELLKTEIFNNKNIDFKLNINAETILNNLNFKNFKIKSKIQDGLIDVDGTELDWKNDVKFKLQESLIYVRDGELILDCKLQINIEKHDEIYKYLLTPKNYRNKISKINLNLSYNFDQKIADLDNIQIDNKINQNVNNILSNIILRNDNLQNKIYFKNLLNNAIKSYAG